MNTLNIQSTSYSYYIYTCISAQNYCFLICYLFTSVKRKFAKQTIKQRPLKTVIYSRCLVFIFQLFNVFVVC